MYILLMWWLRTTSKTTPFRVQRITLPFDIEYNQFDKWNLLLKLLSSYIYFLKIIFIMQHAELLHDNLHLKWKYKSIKFHQLCGKFYIGQIYAYNLLWKIHWSFVRNEGPSMDLWLDMIFSYDFQNSPNQLFVFHPRVSMRDRKHSTSLIKTIASNKDSF